jgi:hypothetical protein
MTIRFVIVATILLLSGITILGRRARARRSHSKIYSNKGRMLTACASDAVGKHLSKDKHFQGRSWFLRCVLSESRARGEHVKEVERIAEICSLASRQISKFMAARVINTSNAGWGVC